MQHFFYNNKLYLHIIRGFISAILFSAFIYFEHYGITVKFINTFFGLLAITSLLYLPKRSVLAAGFFIGLFWFYWIGYSFKYNGVGYLAPFVTLGFAIIYTLFFGVLAFTDKPYIRALLLFVLSFIEPMDWNWMQIELLFVDSYLGIYKYQLALILASLTIPFYIKNKYKFLPLFILVLATPSLSIYSKEQKDTDLKIKLVATDIKQDKKWLRSSLDPTLIFAYKEMRKAIQQGYDVIVFPESFFPIYMNQNPRIIDQLRQISYDITIVTGSLYYEKPNNYNVTYLFQNGEYSFAKKLVLVPFGEYVPLPKFAQDFINDTFFAGQADFKTAEKPSDLIIKGEKFRNAICYEATCSEIYEGEVDYVIATSNNAWFAPSIEPTLQKLLMQYYARKNGVTIYHSANYKGSGIIK
ncbi:apolipoprotein N-acyltransferase [Sulfurimonas sp.]|uniref:apolipoprotein N-acyltransferase n=1 Tax=Sulfurimonas sp. TaxID=2022749 RepID=UPI0035683C01